MEIHKRTNNHVLQTVTARFDQQQSRQGVHMRHTGSSVLMNSCHARKMRMPAPLWLPNSRSDRRCVAEEPVEDVADGVSAHCAREVGIVATHSTCARMTTRNANKRCIGNTSTRQVGHCQSCVRVWVSRRCNQANGNQMPHALARTCGGTRNLKQMSAECIVGAVEGDHHMSDAMGNPVWPSEFASESSRCHRNAVWAK